MRILVISDIHANLTALDAVLTSAEDDYDSVWCMGDLVGYGPDPNECIERIRSLPNLICLLGNHDAAALGQIDLEAFNREARQSASWMRSILTEDNMTYLGSLPEKVVIGQVTLVHGSPRNPVWEYLMDKYTVAVNFDYFDTDLCIVGHTHMPVVFLSSPGMRDIDWRVTTPDVPFQLTQRAILNPGSVGQPRDRDPRAAFAIFDTQEMTWTSRRVVYDITSVQERIQKAGLPTRHASRLSEGF